MFTARLLFAGLARIIRGIGTTYLPPRNQKRRPDRADLSPTSKLQANR